MKLLCRSNKQYTTIKGETWSRGTNSRLPFGANVNLSINSLRSRPNGRSLRENYTAFSLTWPASMQIYRNKIKVFK